MNNIKETKEKNELICSNALHTYAEWWELLAKEREQMMLTIASMEMVRISKLLFSQNSESIY